MLNKNYPKQIFDKSINPILSYKQTFSILTYAYKLVFSAFSNNIQLDVACPHVPWSLCHLRYSFFHLQGKTVSSAPKQHYIIVSQ